MCCLWNTEINAKQLQREPEKKLWKRAWGVSLDQHIAVTQDAVFELQNK